MQDTPQYRHSVRPYFRAVKRHWLALVGSNAPLGALGIASQAFDFTVPRSVWFLAIAIGFVGANFVIFHDLHTQNLRLVTAQDPGSRSTATTTGLVAWLNERATELRALKGTVEKAGESATEARVGLWHSMLGTIEQKVVAKLWVRAPQWADYYTTNPDWYNEENPEESVAALVRLIEADLDQIAHIIDRLQEAS